jgi:hypothetical protein
MRALEAQCLAWRMQFANNCCRPLKLVGRHCAEGSPANAWNAFAEMEGLQHALYV